MGNGGWLDGLWAPTLLDTRYGPLSSGTNSTQIELESICPLAAGFDLYPSTSPELDDEIVARLAGCACADAKRVHPYARSIDNRSILLTVSMTVTYLSVSHVVLLHSL